MHNRPLAPHPQVIFTVETQVIESLMLGKQRVWRSLLAARRGVTELWLSCKEEPELCNSGPRRHRRAADTLLPSNSDPTTLRQKQIQRCRRDGRERNNPKRQSHGAASTRCAAASWGCCRESCCCCCCCCRRNASGVARTTAGGRCTDRAASALPCSADRTC